MSLTGRRTRGLCPGSTCPTGRKSARSSSCSTCKERCELRWGLPMSDALLPPPYDQLGHRPFSFYPAIVNIEHNEWRLRKATWSEFLVLNTKTAEEIWIPRRF